MRLVLPSIVFQCYPDHRVLHSFPTRRSSDLLFIGRHGQTIDSVQHLAQRIVFPDGPAATRVVIDADGYRERSEEHTSELQSRQYLVCRLLLEKKKRAALSGRCHLTRTR